MTAGLPRHVGHCVWADKECGLVEALEWAGSVGLGFTAPIAHNRVGLPRRYLAQAKAKLRCPKGCQHTAASSSCCRGRWAVMHKGTWELCLWCTGSGGILAIMSNVTSSTRLYDVALTCSKQIVQFRQPEPMAFYQFFGRGGTDGGDQERKRLSIANRRQKRVGPKGALFDFEIGCVDGKIVAEELRSKSLTVWDFTLEFIRQTLASVSTRLRVPAHLQALKAVQCDDTEDAIPAQVTTRAQAASHVPVDVRRENRKRRRAGLEAPPRWAGRSSTCCCAPHCPEGVPKHAEWWCGGCDRWYHPECFWPAHEVRVRK